jgi:hypothetical protein
VRVRFGHPINYGSAWRIGCTLENHRYKEEPPMADADSRKLWERFDSELKELASELRSHYESAGDEKKTAELNRSLEQLRRAADAVFASLETTTRDPEVRAKTKQAARSFGSALAQSFRELGDEIDKALRKPAGTK